jgi:hypothetical protein
MRWFKKYFGRADYVADQEKIAALHLALKGPRGVVMLAAGEKILDHTVYIRIPEQLAASFPDYEPADAPTESRVSGLYGDQRDLDQYIKIRR